MMARSHVPEPGVSGWRGAVDALALRSFRLWAGANLLFSTSFGARQTTFAWAALASTGSAVAVGWAVALQLLPFLVLGLVAGVVVDRRNRRHTILTVQMLNAALSLVLGIAILATGLQAWQIFVVAAGFGVVGVFDNPTRQAMLGEVVGSEKIASAVGISGGTFQIGQIVGPAGAGVLIAAAGTGWTFVAIGCVSLAELALMLAVRGRDLTPALPSAARRGELRELFRYIAHRSEIVAMIVVIAAISVFISTMPVLLSSFAADVFGLGSEGFGFFTATVAAGSLIGAGLSLLRRAPDVRGVILTAMVLAVAQSVTSALSGPAVFVGGLIVVGMVLMLADIGNLSIVHLATEPEVKGRVMALYSIVLMGGQGVGSVAMGALVAWTGPRTAMLASGVATLCVLAVLAMAVRRRLR